MLLQSHPDVDVSLAAVRVLNKQLNVDLDASDGTPLAAVEDTNDGSSSYRYRRIINSPNPAFPDPRIAARSERFQGSLPPWVWRRLQGFIEHQIMGLYVAPSLLIEPTLIVVHNSAFVGILSFFQLLISITFFSPLNYGLRNTVFRMIRGNRRDGDGAGLGSSMILLMVLLGLLKAFHAVWKAVGVLSQWMLSRLEDSVLDVR